MTLRSNGSYIGPRPAGPSASVASGIWDLRTAERQKRASSWPLVIEPDQNFSSVSVLLHMDGSNGSTTFTDTSGTPKTISVQSGVSISTAESKFGGASGSFAGTGGYISSASNSAFEYGSGDFTIELFAKFTSISDQGLYDTLALNGSSSRSGGFAWVLKSNGYLDFYANGQFRLQSTASLTTGQWYHLVFYRSSGTCGFFIDGVARGTVSYSTTLTESTFVVGTVSDSPGAYSLHAHVDEYRVTKGVARYTGSFTPPTAAFPNA